MKEKETSFKPTFPLIAAAAIQRANIIDLITPIIEIQEEKKLKRINKIENKRTIFFHKN